MAMKDALPSSTADLSSPSRRCFRISPCFFRISPCFFISVLILFFLIVQFDLIPQIDTRQVRELQLQVSRYLHKISSSPSSMSPLSSSPSSTASSSSLTSPSPPASSLPSTLSPPPPTSSPPSSSSSSSSLSSLPSTVSPPPPALSPPSSSSSLSSSSSSSKSSPRVAICLVGGARAFELTGPTIKKYLLQAVANSDVFVHTPLDKDSYKLSILTNGIPNLAHVRIFSPKAIPESRAFTDVLTASNSPNGIQGLLQYFNLVEGCIDMIKQYQLQRNLTYEWIIRTRLDGYWINFLPSLETMNHTAYTVPIGSQFGGLNDRLGIGNWETSEVALSRLSLVPVLHAHGARGLNSESAFKQQLKVRKVKHKQKGFPFCILSHRRYGWPPGHYGVPVLSLSSKGNLNGAKCRPCTPVSTGAAAKSIIESQERSWSWPGSIKKPDLCNPISGWQADWKEIFDSVAGLENAKIRKSISNQSFSDCIEANEAFKKQVEVWDAPHPSAICEKGLITS